MGGAIGAGVPSPSQAKRANELRSGSDPDTIRATPTHRRASMPKTGGPTRQRVSHHGTKPATVPGARMKNTSDASEAQKRRMVHPHDRATRLGAGWYTLDALPFGPRRLRFY